MALTRREFIKHSGIAVNLLNIAVLRQGRWW